MFADSVLIGRCTKKITSFPRNIGKKQNFWRIFLHFPVILSYTVQENVEKRINGLFMVNSSNQSIFARQRGLQPSFNKNHVFQKRIFLVKALGNHITKSHNQMSKNANICTQKKNTSLLLLDQTFNRPNFLHQIFFKKKSNTLLLYDRVNFFYPKYSF